MMTKATGRKRKGTPVEIIGVRFESIEDACHAVGFSRNALLGKCRSKDKRWRNWKLLERASKIVLPEGKTVRIGADLYQDLEEASKLRAISPRIIHSRCIKQAVVRGEMYSYLEDQERLKWDTTRTASELPSQKR